MKYDLSVHTIAELGDAVMRSGGLTRMTPGACRLLAVAISQRTKRRISETTLKRIYGFASCQVRPSFYTLDVLAQFCGYQGLIDWQRAWTAAPEELVRCGDFSKLFYLSEQPMYIIDQVSLQFIEVNAAAVEIYGYSRERFLSMHLFDIRPPHERALVLAALSQLRENDHCPGPFQHIRADGSIRSVRIVTYRLDLPRSRARLVMPLNVN